MAVHMRANCALKAGSERMSLAWVWANCWRSERKTVSCVDRAEVLASRRYEPWEAKWREVRRERSKAPMPTPLRDILTGFGRMEMGMVVRWLGEGE